MNTHAPPSWGAAKIRPRSQHTQKSFSTINSGMPVRVALIASIICFAIGVLLALVIRSIKKDESGLSFQQIKESLLLFVFGGGFVGFIAGFLGPLIFAPEAN